MTDRSLEIPSRTTMLDIIVKPADIYYVCFIFEAYEGIAVVSTLQPELGLIRLHVAPGCEADVRQILEAERDALGWREVQAVE